MVKRGEGTLAMAFTSRIGQRVECLGNALQGPNRAGQRGMTGFPPGPAGPTVYARFWLRHRTVPHDLECLDDHRVDVPGAVHAIRLSADPVGVLLAEVVQQHRAIGPLGHGQPGRRRGATELKAVVLGVLRLGPCSVQNQGPSYLTASSTSDIRESREGTEACQ
jgi:hypothetical protein